MTPFVATVSRPRVIVAVAEMTSRVAAAVSAVAGRSGVMVCAGEQELDECFARYEVSFLVVEMASSNSVGMLSRLMLRREPPTVVVLTAGRLPVRQIIRLCLGHARFQLAHDAGEVSSAIRSMMDFPGGESEIGTIARALDRRLDRASLEYVLGLLILGQRRMSVREASERLGKPSGLRNELRARSLPRAARLLGWGGALHLLWQMERFGVDLNSASRLIGFQTTRQCSDAVKYHTGRSPLVLARDGGFEWLLSELAHRLGREPERRALKSWVPPTAFLRNNLNERRVSIPAL